MEEIGVRELKRDLSGYLRRAAEGEEIRVTVRGEPLVDIVPAPPSPTERLLRRLAAEGRVTRATTNRRAPAPAPVRTTRSGSDIVIEGREEG